MRILKEQIAFSGWERVAQAHSSKSILSTDKGGLLDVYWQTLTGRTDGQYSPVYTEATEVGGSALVTATVASDG